MIQEVGEEKERGLGIRADVCDELQANYNSMIWI